MSHTTKKRQYKVQNLLIIYHFEDSRGTSVSVEGKDGLVSVFLWGDFPISLEEERR